MLDWYVNEGKDNDVVLSTKACIVRNVKGYNFLPRLDDKECQSLIETVDGAIDKDTTWAAALQLWIRIRS